MSTPALIGWGLPPAPKAPNPLNRKREVSRRAIADLLAVPHAASAVKAADLVERYGMNRSTAYHVLRRARDLHVKHAAAGGGEGQP